MHRNEKILVWDFATGCGGVRCGRWQGGTFSALRDIDGTRGQGAGLFRVKKDGRKGWGRRGKRAGLFREGSMRSKGRAKRRVGGTGK